MPASNKTLANNLRLDSSAQATSSILRHVAAAQRQRPGYPMSSSTIVRPRAGGHERKETRWRSRRDRFLVADRDRRWLPTFADARYAERGTVRWRVTATNASPKPPGSLSAGKPRSSVDRSSGTPRSRVMANCRHQLCSQYISAALRSQWTRGCKFSCEPQLARPRGGSQQRRCRCPGACTRT